MKKIVGILSAAVIATSMFAADFSAGIKLAGSLFNYDGASENVSALTLKHANSKDDVPFNFTVSSDKAGAQLKFYDKNGGTKETPMEANFWKIWFKPVDMLTVTIGDIGQSMNTETITYWKGKVLGSTKSWGYEATVAVDAFTLNAGLAFDYDKGWFAKAKDVDAVLDNLYLKAAYSADFGTISALADFSNTFKNIGIAAGYKNSFGDISMFADVAFKTVKDGANELLVDADVVYAKDALNIQGYVRGDLKNLEKIEKDTIEVFLIARLQYVLDAGTVFVKFEDENLLANKFGCTITPGFDGSVGIMSYEVAAEVKVANEKVSVGVPVWFKVNF